MITSTGAYCNFFNFGESIQKNATANFFLRRNRDHLGNIRLSYADSNNDGIITASSDPNTNEIIEESNYYPFGLKHKGYNIVTNSLGNSTAQKFKYNGTEYEESLGLNLYEMDLRSYDPAIARWTSIDPVVHHSMSTYTAFDNNPVFWADPSGADSIYNDATGEYVIDGKVVDFQEALDYANNGGNADGSNNNTPDDDITVNSKGIVTSVVENGKPNRFFDENGNQLFFNDSENVDKVESNGKWVVGERMFYALSIEEVNEEIIKSGIIFERYLSNGNAGIWLYSLLKAANYGHSNYDFAENYLISLSEDKISSGSSLFSSNRATYADDTAFFRFGNTTGVYNLYDAGNYMWGKAMGISGFSFNEVRAGSQANELFRDKKADQNAIKKGFYGK